MKTTTWSILVILAVVFISQCGKTDSVTPEPTPAPTPDDSGSTGAVGSIRDGMAALKKINEEIDAARKSGDITLKIKLPTFKQETARVGTCETPRDIPKLTTTGDCDVCQPEYDNDSPGPSPTVYAPSGNRRGLFTRRWTRRR